MFMYRFQKIFPRCSISEITSVSICATQRLYNQCYTTVTMATFSRGKPCKQQKEKITCSNSLNESVENWVIFTWFALSAFICLVVTVYFNCPPLVHKPSHLQIPRKGGNPVTQCALIYCCQCFQHRYLSIPGLSILVRSRILTKSCFSVVKKFQISL